MTASRAALFAALLLLILGVFGCAPLGQKKDVPTGSEDPEVRKRIERLQTTLKELQEQMALMQAQQALESGQKRQGPPVWQAVSQWEAVEPGYGLYTYVLSDGTSESQAGLASLLQILDALSAREDLDKSQVNRFIVPASDPLPQLNLTAGSYNADLAQPLLTHLPESIQKTSPGPFLLTTSHPLRQDETLPETLLFDLGRCSPEGAERLVSPYMLKIPSSSSAGLPSFAPLLWSLLRQMSPASASIRVLDNTVVLQCSP